MGAQAKRRNSMVGAEAVTHCDAHSSNIRGASENEADVYDFRRSVKKGASQCVTCVTPGPDAIAASRRPPRAASAR